MVELPRADIAQAALEVLERMGFLLGEPSDPERMSAPLAPLRARIEFRGASRGSLEVVTSAALALGLAGGVLGRAVEELDESHARDALAELLNVLLGHLREWLGPMSVPLESGLPAVAPVAHAADWERLLAREGAIVLDIEGEPFALTLGLEASREVA